MLKMSLFMKYGATPKISTIFWPFLATFTLFHLQNLLQLQKPELRNLPETWFWLLLVNNELCSMPPSWTPPDINNMPGESCVKGLHSYLLATAVLRPICLSTIAAMRLWRSPHLRWLGLCCWVGWLARLTARWLAPNSLMLSCPLPSLSIAANISCISSRLLATPCSWTQQDAWRRSSFIFGVSTMLYIFSERWM